MLKIFHGHICFYDSFTEVLEEMRKHLSRGGYTQIPQLSSMNPIDVSTKFDLVPETHEGGTKRAVMIGINYVGEFQLPYIIFLTTISNAVLGCIGTNLTTSIAKQNIST